VVAALLAHRHGVKQAARRMLVVTPRFVGYHQKKALDPTFHPGKHGGRRYSQFSPERQAMIELFVWGKLKADPTLRVYDYVTALAVEAGVTVNRWWIDRLFARWGFTWKKPMYKQLLKYTAANIIHTVHYVVSIRDVPLHRLKYLDEASFASRSLRRARALSEKGRPVHITSNNSISETYTVTILTKLDAVEPVVVSNFRTDTNTAEDFLNCVRQLVVEFHLWHGDVLVLDNAPVHCAERFTTELRDLLDAANVKVWFLPKYSPELNPCELVFAQTKRWLRTHRSLTSRPFWLDLACAFAEVTLANVAHYYTRCLNLEFP
jgi:transposase